METRLRNHNESPQLKAHNRNKMANSVNGSDTDSVAKDLDANGLEKVSTADIICLKLPELVGPKAKQFSGPGRR